MCDFSFLRLIHPLFCSVLQLATAIPFEILWDRFWTRRSFHVAEGLDIHMGDVIGCDEAKSEVEQVCVLYNIAKEYIYWCFYTQCY